MSYGVTVWRTKKTYRVASILITDRKPCLEDWDKGSPFCSLSLPVEDALLKLFSLHNRLTRYSQSEHVSKLIVLSMNFDGKRGGW